MLGGGDARLRAGPVLYAPMKGRNDTYTVGIDSATLGDALLPVPTNATAFIDTGTSLAYLPKEFFEAITKVRTTEKSRSTAIPRGAGLGSNARRPRPSPFLSHQRPQYGNFDRRCRSPSTARSWASPTSARQTPSPAPSSTGSK